MLSWNPISLVGAWCMDSHALSSVPWAPVFAVFLILKSLLISWCEEPGPTHHQCPSSPLEPPAEGGTALCCCGRGHSKTEEAHCKRCPGLSHWDPPTPEFLIVRVRGSPERAGVRRGWEQGGLARRATPSLLSLSSAFGERALAPVSRQPPAAAAGRVH